MSLILLKMAIHCFNNACSVQNIVIWCVIRSEISRLSDIAVVDDSKNCQKRRLLYFAVLEVDTMSSFEGTLYFERHFLLQSHLLPHTCCNRMQKPSYPKRIRGFNRHFIRFVQRRLLLAVTSRSPHPIRDREATQSRTSSNVERRTSHTSRASRASQRSLQLFTSLNQIFDLSANSI